MLHSSVSREWKRHRLFLSSIFGSTTQSVWFVRSFILPSRGMGKIGSKRCSNRVVEFTSVLRKWSTLGSRKTPRVIRLWSPTSIILAFGRVIYRPLYWRSDFQLDRSQDPAGRGWRRGPRAFLLVVSLLGTVIQWTNQTTTKPLMSSLSINVFRRWRRTRTLWFEHY